VRALAPASLAWIDDELAAIRAKGLERTLLELTSAPGPMVEFEGRHYLLLGSNNYLDLAAHPEVMEGAVSAVRRLGAGAGASRLVSGATGLHAELENELAAILGVEAVLLFSSGYLANVSTIQALVGKDDEVFSDALNHASLIDGCRLSGAHVTVYSHADIAELGRALAASTARRKLIVSDSVFSMEGDSAPVKALGELAAATGAMLMLDESHAFGVLGENGAGLAPEARPSAVGMLVMGTLSKALGSAGGFIGGSAELVHYLRHRARGFVFDTAPAPAAVGAALAALRLMAREPGRRARLLELTARLRHGISGLGVPLGTGDAAIVPLLVGAPDRAMRMAASLRERGVIAPAIRPPSVPDGTSRLRLTVSAGFTDVQVDTAVAALVEVAAHA
jgi:8-amino-7-oxononanoate synthase